MKTAVYKILHMAYDQLKKTLKAINSIRIKYHLYSKRILPPFDPSVLEKYYPYHESNCVSFDFKMNNECIFDLSVIIPLYNSENYLPNLMKDLLNQKTQYKYEIILINDGSKDNTDILCLELAKTYPDKIIYIEDTNHGISYARNKGIETARGRFIAFIDHDDRVSDDYIELLLNESDDAEIVNCLYGVIRDGRLKEIGISSGFVWGGIYRKSLFQNIRFPVGFWYEDMINPILLYKLANNIKLVEKVIYHYTISPIQATKTLWKNNNPKALDQLYLVYGLCKDYNKLGFEDDEYLFLRILKECSMLMYTRTKGLDKNASIQIFLACRELILKKYKKSYNISQKDNEWLDAFMNLDYPKWKLLGKT